MPADVLIEDHGSIALVTFASPAAQQWATDNIQAEGWQWWGQALAVEPRCLPAIVDGLWDDGLEVQS